MRARAPVLLGGAAVMLGAAAAMLGDRSGARAPAAAVAAT